MEEEGGNGGSRKRVRPSDEEEKEGETGDGMSLDENETTKLVASDEMELRISQILDKIESFTQTVKALMKLHNAFLDMFIITDDYDSSCCRKETTMWVCEMMSLWWDEEEKEGETGDGMSLDENETTKLVASDEMELRISQILDKIESFTQTVKALMKLHNAFLDMFIITDDYDSSCCRIHKEHVEKWQEEIKELRLLDASNEETTSLLHNARFLIQNPNIDA
ncbi:hypothetical protein Bca52824_095256 [Brassica carinata]|uniref:Uncharacterized protein n=1 Tax=Brassica carinata TaxID=52824 RepID=A0A8X7P1N7_BRACI|nr:hypothetical protein Bca52824_095256 [Brassica carinata]